MWAEWVWIRTAGAVARETVAAAICSTPGATVHPGAAVAELGGL